MGHGSEASPEKARAAELCTTVLARLVHGDGKPLCMQQSMNPPKNQELGGIILNILRILGKLLSPWGAARSQPELPFGDRRVADSGAKRGTQAPLDLEVSGTIARPPVAFWRPRAAADATVCFTAFTPPSPSVANTC